MMDLTLLFAFGNYCRVDPDSTLHKDLMQLRGQEGTDHVLLNMTFTVSTKVILECTYCTVMYILNIVGLVHYEL